MSTEIAAIPTTFSGVNFRSRLEAKWAAFFDNIKWRWEYEPIDQKGWIPDFVVWPGSEPIFADIKPLLSAHEWSARNDELEDLRDGKVVLSLGATIPIRIMPDHEDSSGVPIGALHGAGWFKWGTAYLTSCPSRNHLTVWNGYDDSWSSFVCGCKAPILSDGLPDNKWFSHFHDPTNVAAEAKWAWREAGNLVQWLKDGSAPSRKTRQGTQK